MRDRTEAEARHPSKSLIRPRNLPIRGRGASSHYFLFPFPLHPRLKDDEFPIIHLFVERLMFVLMVQF
jgi:hypothetical protein